MAKRTSPWCYKRLTERFVESLPSPRDRFAFVWDDEIRGFGVRVMPSGIKTYVFDYKLDGMRHRVTIGRHGERPIDEIRGEAERMRGLVSSGVDPREGRRRRGEPTFEELADEYIARRCGEKKSGREDARIIRKDLLPVWRRKLAREVTRRDVMLLVDDVKDRGAPIMANRTLSVVGRLFNFGIDRDLVQSNPAIRVRPVAKETRRERVLSAEEIRRFWRALDELAADPVTKTALRLVVITAARPGEVVGLEWREIDEENVWTIPAAKSKNGLPHRVPLSDLALEVLSALPRDDRGGFAFLSPVKLDRPIARHALARALYREREVLGLEPFTPHDLRRTAASMMASAGVSRVVLSKVLNHVERGVTAIYDRHSYDLDKRAALDAWAAKLRDIIAGRKTKVVPLVR